MVSSERRWPSPTGLKVSEPSPWLGRKRPAMLPRKLPSCQRYWNSSFCPRGWANAVVPAVSRARTAARRMQRVACGPDFIPDLLPRLLPRRARRASRESIAAFEDLADLGGQLAAAE